MEAPPPISLAIAPQASFIASKTFVEMIYPHELQQLIESDFLKDKWDLTNYSQKVAAQSYINERQQLQAYQKNFKKTLQGIPVKYNKAKHKWGRVFPAKSLGLTSLAKRTRNTLIRNHYYDFDLSNAQPEILRNICLSNNIPCPFVDKYCNEREAIIADIIKASEGKADRDQVKSLMISLSFFGGFEGWLKENDIAPFPEPLFVKNYHRELGLIATIFIRANPEMYETMKRLKQAKGEKNVVGSFLSTYLQEYELRIIEAIAEDLCVNTNVCATCLVNFFALTYEFDGIKLLRSRVDAIGMDFILERINQSIKKIGFDMRCELKNMDKFYDIKFLPPPIEPSKAEQEEAKAEAKAELQAEKNRLKAELEYLKEEAKERSKIEKAEKKEKAREDLLNDASQLLAQDDKEACDIIYNQLKDRLICSQKKLYFKYKSLWHDDKEEIKSLVRAFITSSGVRRLDEYNKPVAFLQHKRCATDVMNLVLDEAVKNFDNDWCVKMFASSLGYILFNNGYYSFKAGKFFAADDPDYDHSIIFLEQTSYAYEECCDESYIADVKKRLFILPFGEAISDFYLLNLARGLAGDAMKRILFGVGNGDSGKSTITMALKSVCGGYFGSFNGNNLTMKQFANPDDAQALRWVLNLCSKRIIASNEIAAGVPLNGEMIKKLASGGADDITARGLYQNEREFQVFFLPIVFANDLDKITPMDDAILNRVRAIPYTKTYVDVVTNEFELLKDVNLKEEIATAKFKNAFMCLLMRAYAEFMAAGRVENDACLPELKKAVASVFGVVSDYVTQFKADFNLTNSENDFVESSVIQDWIKQGKLNITITKMGRDIHKYATLKGLENIRPHIKKIGGKSKSVWLGVKMIDGSEGNDEDC